MNASDRSMRGRLGAHAMHSRHDARETTAAARRSFLDRFEDEVDPGRVLPEAERRRRAEHAKRAYFTRLALKSAQARRARVADEGSERKRRASGGSRRASRLDPVTADVAPPSIRGGSDNPAAREWER